MSLTIRPCCMQLSFGAKSLPKPKRPTEERLATFVSNQASHIVYQVGILAGSETLKPSSTLSEFIARKLFIDMVENATAHLHGVKITAKNQGINILSWITDGWRALDKATTKKSVSK